MDDFDHALIAAAEALDTAARELQKLEAASRRREELAAPVEPAPGWSEWLTHNGGSCPLPPGTAVQLVFRDGHESKTTRVGCWGWGTSDIIRYRYRYTIPGGWVARPEGWVPPRSLWAKGSPVRCEWTLYRTELVEPIGIMEAGYLMVTAEQADRTNITHIRLLPAEPAKAEMPEGFFIDADGYLRMSNSLWVVGPKELRYYGTATIRAAIAAWCAAMEERG